MRSTGTLGVLRGLRSGVAALLLVAAAGLVLACGTLSPQREQSLGEQAAREMRRQLEFVDDEFVVDYVEDMGRELLAAAGPQPYDFRFYVVRAPELNAFALPAGYIYLNTGLLLSVDNASELAGVMAHEIAHVALRHVAQNYQRQRNTRLFYETGSVLASVLVGGPVAAGGQLAGQLLMVGYLNQFSQAAEEEADAYAVEILPRAGYDPNGLLTFFETLQAEAGSEGALPFLSSHPTTAQRIQDTAGRIAAAPLSADLRVSDGGRLEIIQRRIELLGEARR